MTGFLLLFDRQVQHCEYENAVNAKQVAAMAGNV